MVPINPCSRLLSKIGRALQTVGRLLGSFAIAAVVLGWATASTVGATAWFGNSQPPMLAQAAGEQPEGTPAEAIPNPQQFRALEQESSRLSLQRAETLMKQAKDATEARNYDRAIQLLQDAFDAFNARSNYHQALSRTFAGIDNRIADSQREAARVTAQSRDEAAYELAIVYRAANRPEDAVSQLVQVVSSQGPTRDLGRKAYQQLFEIGFVDTPLKS
jgi:thioredoxin-like negative regulator of GroEL